MGLTLPLAPEVPGDVGVLGIPVFARRVVPPGAQVELDGDWLAGRRFEGKLGETLSVPADDGSTIVAVGMGDPAKLTAEGMRRAAAALVRAAGQDAVVATTLLSAAPVGGLAAAAAAAALAEGAVLGTYRFVRYKGDPRPCRLERLVVVGSGPGLRAALDRGARVAAAVALARDLVNEPAGT
ncbi:MAG TPA: M17 family peptidase N-terminal domain-containing protein, partial [Acidimicrobiales bacterium]|nr:M17 family peptidase N-terminal domain-containing protein [Acidimicrobiales bacterium]